MNQNLLIIGFSLRDRLLAITFGGPFFQDLVFPLAVLGEAGFRPRQWILD